MAQSVLGIFGGSGFYNLPGIANARWQRVAGPWGEASDEILFADIDGLPIRFLPRHGRGHRIPPSAINHRANVDAMKRAGVTDLVSISACGSLREEYAPGHFARAAYNLGNVLAGDFNLHAIGVSHGIGLFGKFEQGASDTA